MPTPSSKPTRARHWVVVFAVTLAVITYIDRVCISQAAPSMRRDLGLTPVQMGYAFAAFGWAYALFEVPGGWLGDWIGPRKVLMRVVLWWSFFTAATGWVWGQVSLVITRFLFGAGEAGSYVRTVSSVEKVREGGNTLYTVFYVDAQGVEYKLAFYYEPGNGGVMRWKNQRSIAWTR